MGAEATTPCATCARLQAQVAALSKTIDLAFARIQFTIDLLPGGTRTSSWEPVRGRGSR